MSRWIGRGVARQRPPTVAPAGSVERNDRQLLAVLDRDVQRAAGRAGSWLKCGPGCSACCHGPFPVTRLDAWRLRGGLQELFERDPHRARSVEDRANRAVAILSDGFPGNAESGRLSRDENRLDSFFERHSALACPALDPGTGRCELYESRPVSCRTYGPPLRFDEQSAPHCRLCFQGAEAQTIERCRIAPDRANLEQAILRRLGVAPGEEWETLIAFVLGRR